MPASSAFVQQGSGYVVYISTWGAQELLPLQSESPILPEDGKSLITEYLMFFSHTADVQIFIEIQKSLYEGIDYIAS